MPPQLPPRLIESILTHLLPPTPPIPAALTAKPLLDRLAFLPPCPDNVDAFLSPVPPKSSGSISERLVELSRDHERSTVQYAHDGELLLGRVRLTLHGRGKEGGVDLVFSFEEGDERNPGRGWVYHASELASTSSFNWTADIDTLGTSLPATIDTDPAPEDYWAGFTPPSPKRPLPEVEDQVDTDYWASYGSTETPGLDTASNPLSAKASPEITRSFSAKHLSFSPTRSELRPPNTANGDAGRAVDDLRDKILGKILSMLRGLWEEYSSAAKGSEDMTEEKALGWLRMGHAVVDQIQDEGVSPSSAHETETIIKAKMETLREMFAVTTTDDAEEAFWRLVEGAVKVPMGRAGDDRDQLGYWE